MMEAAGLDVSRETLEKLHRYAQLVTKWTGSINLISRPSIPQIWERHILDSAQVHRLAPSCETWLDIGSGGGFPGIVVAILATEKTPDLRMTLVESDQRKAAFLRTVIRELELSLADVICDRIENLEPQSADVLSARALTNLTSLFEYADRHLSKGGLALFQKGVTWREEVETAREKWRFNLEAIKSTTSTDAAILKVEDIVRV